MENLRFGSWIYENKDNCDFGFNRLGRGARHPKFGYGRTPDLFLEDHHVADHLYGGAFSSGIRLGFFSDQTEEKIIIFLQACGEVKRD